MGEKTKCVVCNFEGEKLPTHPNKVIYREGHCYKCDFICAKVQELYKKYEETLK